MYRKLIPHGDSTLTISLPIKWIKKNLLKKGDVLEVEENDEGIRIRKPIRMAAPREITIDVKNAGRMLERLIAAPYKAGFEVLEIRFASADELEGIQGYIRNHLAGFEVVEQRFDSIRLKNTAPSEYKDFDLMLRRFFLVLIQMSRDVAEAVNDTEKLKKIKLYYKTDLSRYSDYCRRAINCAGSKNSGPLYTIVEYLEKICDCYEDFCTENISQRMSQEVLHVLKESSEFLHFFYEMFYGFDTRKFVEFGRRKQQIDTKLSNAAKKANKNVKAVFIIAKMVDIIFYLNGTAAVCGLLKS